MNRRIFNRRTVILGTAGLAALTGVGASRLAGLVVRRGAPLTSLVPDKPVGEPVRFSLSGLDGINQSLPLHRPFLLHLWATWCPPCRHELPALAAFMRDWGADCPVVPVAVSSGSPEKVSAFLAQNDVSGLPVWVVGDVDLKAWVGMTQLAIPVTFLIDGDGRVRASSSGPLDWSGAGSVEALRKVLAGIRG